MCVCVCECPCVCLSVTVCVCVCVSYILLCQVMSSQEALSPGLRESPPRGTRSHTGTLDRSRSRSYVINDISIDEGVALKRITQEVSKQLWSPLTSTII